MNAKTKISILALSAMAFTACSQDRGETAVDDSTKTDETVVVDTELPSGLAYLDSRRSFEPQVTFLKEGTLVLTWRERADSGSNLYASVRTLGGDFGEPVRVNDTVDTVESFTHDGMRAAIAVGAGNTIAVAWSDSRAEIRAAISANGGRSFEPSFRLDQSGEPAYRGFPSISFDASGNLHAIWIDSRFAEDFAEEPADLYYAKVSSGKVEEMNLTADQEPSICGCCRTFINAEDDLIKMTFRNTTADGYRDPHTIVGNVTTGFSAPQSVSAPLWELNGCPMAGPILANGEVLWHDGSTGKKLIMVSSMDQHSAQRVFDDADRGDWIGRQPPRAVSTTDGASSVLLIPGQPESRLISRIQSGWATVSNDLPSWATSGAYGDGHLYLVGAPGGDFHFESRQISTDIQSHF
jgi:hypothetical protein